MNATYTTGTKTSRVKTARIVPGDQLLTGEYDLAAYATSMQTMVGRTRYDGTTCTQAEVDSWIAERTEWFANGEQVIVAQRKTGSVVRTVARTEASWTTARGRRTQKHYRVVFTDGTYSSGHAPIQTWDKVEVLAPAKPKSSLVAAVAAAAVKSLDEAAAAKVTVPLTVRRDYGTNRPVMVNGRLSHAACDHDVTGRYACRTEYRAAQAAQAASA